MPKFFAVAVVVPRSHVTNLIASGQLSYQVAISCFGTRQSVQCKLYSCSCEGIALPLPVPFALRDCATTDRVKRPPCTL
jgi:hypothetical protein